MIVFPHGGVLRMATQVNVGQMLVLTNLKTRQDAICRVVKVRTYSSSSSYVEVEFTHRQPGYWGVYFESEGPQQAPAVTPAAPAVNGGSGDAKLSALGASTPRAASDDSTFIHFGSQEEVQLAATSMSSSSSSASSLAGKGSLSIAGLTPSKKLADANAEASKAEGSSSAGDVSQTLAESSESRSGRASEAFGSRLSSGASSEEQAESGKKWIAIGAGGAVLLVAIIGATVFLGHKPAGSPASAPQSVVQQTPPPQREVTPPAPVTVTPTSSVARPNVTPSATSQPVSAPVIKPARETATVRESAVVRESPSEPAPVAEVSPAPAAAPASASKSSMPSVFGTLNAHPVARSRNVAAAAPNVDAGPTSAGPGNALLGITSAANGSALPAPAFNPNIPVAVGGRVKQPVLIKNVVPQYPMLARQAHTQGDVAVQVVVDRAGNIVDAKAISGPTVLRPAAVEAVRGWKYEPTMLDGQAISVQMLVTLRFQL
jgi:protein TonB